MMMASATSMIVHSEKAVHEPFGCFSDVVLTVVERLSAVFFTVAVSVCSCREESDSEKLCVFLWVTLCTYAFVPLLSSGIVIHRLSHVSSRSSAFAVRLVVSLRLAWLALLSLLCSWSTVCRVCVLFVEAQLTADRATAAMRANLYSLDGLAEPVECPACAGVLVPQVFRCLGCIIYLSLGCQ